jgi:hypothetical protein
MRTVKADLSHRKKEAAREHEVLFFLFLIFFAFHFFATIE